MNEQDDLVIPRRSSRSFWIAIMLCAVAAVTQAEQDSSGIVAASPTEEATNFTIDSRCDHTSIVSVTNAWPGAEPLRYAVVRPGAPEIRDDDFSGVIEAPVRRVISLSSTLIPHISDLGMIDTIVGVDNGDYIYNEAIHSRIESGTIREVGSAETLDVELVIALQPDLVLLSVIGGDDPTLRRLAAAGVPTMVIADWRETTPLGRAEWIRLFGLIYERQAAADTLYRERAERYRSIAKRVAGVPQRERPTVLLNAPWQGAWPVPRGGSYVAQLFEDAGGTYLWEDTTGTGTEFLDFEVVLQRGIHADYWFNLNFGWRSRNDAIEYDSRLATFEAYRRRRMYHYVARTRRWGANDFWESGAARPDVVLADLVHILHPNALPDHSLVYYTRLP